MDKNDIEHKLLKGSEIYFGEIPTYRITLGQMVDFKFGYSMFQKIVGIICMNDEKASEFLHENIHPTTWNLILCEVYSEISKRKTKQINADDVSITECFLEFFRLFFNKEIKFDEDLEVFIIGSDNDVFQYVLNYENFNELREIIKERNCLNEVEEIDEENPSNEYARKLLEQRKKLREKINKHKSKDGDNSLTMFDLISIFSEAEKMSLEYVYNNYDIFQFNNQFNRLKIMEDFHVNIKALLAGAKSEDVNLKHWLSKINNKDD